MKIGRVTISDRAAAGLYADQSGPEIERRLRAIFGPEALFVAVVIPDELDRVAGVLRQLADQDRCDLIVTTGGTGVAPRDITPEATRSVLDRELPGFGELMRMRSYDQGVRTAVLSRAVAGARGSTLIVNLPGKPRAVAECIGYLEDALVEAVSLLHGQDPHDAPPMAQR